MKFFELAPPSPVTHPFSQVIQSRFKRHLKHLSEAVLILFAVALTACGGGGGGSGTTSFTVGASAGTNGSISPGTTSVDQGSTTSFTVTPDANFRIDSVSGCSGSLAGNIYTTGAITADCTVTATFDTVEFTISTIAGANGGISPTSVDVDLGRTFSFTVTPDANFQIDSVNGCSGSLAGNTYTTGVITADCTVTASFSRIQFTISTSAGANGTISPAKVVDAGSSGHFFVVTPNTGFRYDTVSGCAGDILGNTYETGTITADCTISATFAPLGAFAVLPQYPNNGANWNDYLSGNPDPAFDNPCVVANLTPCHHGGERKVVTVTGKTSCADLTASDSLAAFSWTCNDDSGTAQFTSSGLADGKHLSDLLDVSSFTTPIIRPNSVTVLYKGSVWGVTPQSPWWNNPVENLSFTGSGPSLNSTARIYVVTQSNSTNYTLDADKVSLVIMPGVTLSGPDGGQNSYIIESQFDDFLWLEGSIDAAGDEIGVRLQNVHFSTLRNLASNNANDGNSNNDSFDFDVGVYLQNSDKNRLEDMTLTGNIGSAIYLSQGSGSNRLSRVSATNNGYGIYLNGSRANEFSEVNASSNSDTGISITSSSDFSILENITLSNNGSAGLDFLTYDSLRGSILSNVTANNNQTGVSLQGKTTAAQPEPIPPIIFNTLTVNDNAGRGLWLKAVSGSTFTNVTANNNNVGIDLDFFLDNNAGGAIYGSNNNTFTTVEASGNISNNIILDFSSDNTFTGVSPAINCPLFEQNAGTNNGCSTTAIPPPTPALVEFRIPAGTGSGPWNTQATMLTVNVGDTVRIINDDSVPHAFHAPIVSGPVYQPCPHQDFSSQLATGESYDCVTTGPIDPGVGPPLTYDHIVGPTASFWLRVVAVP